MFLNKRRRSVLAIKNDDTVVNSRAKQKNVELIIPLNKCVIQKRNVKNAASITKNKNVRNVEKSSSSNSRIGKNDLFIKLQRIDDVINKQSVLNVVNNKKITSKTVQIENNNEISVNVPNLRTHIVQPNYEESVVLDESNKILKKKTKIPIYNKALPELKVKNPKDLYEFNDNSPKLKKYDQHQRDHRSSILFDKNTYAILRKIEQNEAKIKKKPPVNKKRYNDIVKDIVSNVKKKILKQDNDAKINKKINLPDAVNRDKNKREKSPIQIEFNNIPCSTPIIISRSQQHEQIEIITDNRNKKSAKNPSIKITGNVILTPATRVENLIIQDFLPTTPDRDNLIIRKSTPWRSDSLNVIRHPYFISLKSNSLPRIDQEPILEHTLVESLNNNFNLTDNNTPKKKSTKIFEENSARQQSILKYITSSKNYEFEQENLTQSRGGSLFDWEDFNSPEKKNINNTKNSSPTKRRILGDLTNINNMDNNNTKKIISVENLTLFGFDESTTIESNADRTENRHDEAQKPFRIDTKSLKNYTRNNNKIQKKPSISVEVLEEIISEIPADEEISVNLHDNNVPLNEEEERKDLENVAMHLFEDPEEILDNMPEVNIESLRKRRKRFNSGDEDDYHRPRTKKVKINVEAEEWAKQFNKMCDEIDQQELTIEEE